MRRRGRRDEVDFVVRRVDDLALACSYLGEEVTVSRREPARTAASLLPAPARIAASAHYACGHPLRGRGRSARATIVRDAMHWIQMPRSRSRRRRYIGSRIEHLVRVATAFLGATAALALLLYLLPTVRLYRVVAYFMPLEPARYLRVARRLATRPGWIDSMVRQSSLEAWR